MSINDESAAHHAAEDDPDLNSDAPGVGTDGSLVSEPDELTDQAADSR